MTNSTPKPAGLDPARILLILAVVGIATGIFVTGVVVLGLAFVDRALSLTVDSEYANRDEAEARLLLSSDGWMPNNMPATMNDIRLRTDLDISFAWATFRTDETGIEEIRTQFKAVPTESVKLPGNPGTRWWPRELKNVQTLNESALEVHACGNKADIQRSMFLALDPNSYQVYYWLR